MAKFSPIAPLPLLRQMRTQGVLDDYLLVLVHDVSPQMYGYLEVIWDTMGDEGTVILDNSLVELGKAADPDTLLKCADYINADYIVLPDVMGDWVGTCEAVKEALPAFTASTFKGGLIKVVQGSTWDEVQTCTAWMHHYVPGDNWAVPRVIANTLESRGPAIDHINRLYDGKDTKPFIHLLGMSNSFLDDVVCARRPNVAGMDSANPVVLGQMGRDLNTTAYKHVPREDFWSHKQLRPEAATNVRYVREAIK